MRSLGLRGCEGLDFRGFRGAEVLDVFEDVEVVAGCRFWGFGFRV